MLQQPSPKKPPAFEGLAPDERNRFGWLEVMFSAPNLLRRVGTSPTVADIRMHAMQKGVRNVPDTFFLSQPTLKCSVLGVTKAPISIGWCMNSTWPLHAWEDIKIEKAITHLDGKSSGRDGKSLCRWLLATKLRIQKYKRCD